MLVKFIFALGSVVLVMAAGLAAALIFGTAPPPPPLRSISAAGDQIAQSIEDLPRLESFQARDKTALAFRRYPGNPARGLAVLIHGSSGSSVEMHLAGKALARLGISAIAIDVRGHGASGRRGDISYAGQLDDDMTDLVRFLAKDYPGEPRILIGHSSGGGYVLHVAASRLACAFKGYIALSPYLNYRAPTVRPGNGGWSGVYMPRIIALSILRRLGITQFEGLPVIAFAIPPGADPTLTRTYSFRLLMDFGLDADWEGAIRRIGRPTRVFVGNKDELFYSGAFEPIFKSLRPEIPVTSVDGVTHMGIALDSVALAAELPAATSLLTDTAIEQCDL